MTNQERIQSHNEQLAEIKEIAAGLPDAGSGGGAVETCTIKIINETVSKGGYVDELGYTYINANGTIDAFYTWGQPNRQSEIILENVICGSYLKIAYMGYSYATANGENGVADLAGTFYDFKAPQTKNSTGIIRIIDDA